MFLFLYTMWSFIKFYSQQNSRTDKLFQVIDFKAPQVIFIRILKDILFPLLKHHLFMDFILYTKSVKNASNMCKYSIWFWMVPTHLMNNESLAKRKKKPIHSKLILWFFWRCRFKFVSPRYFFFIDLANFNVCSVRKRGRGFLLSAWWHIGLGVFISLGI